MSLVLIFSTLARFLEPTDAATEVLLQFVYLQPLSYQLVCVADDSNLDYLLSLHCSLSPYGVNTIDEHHREGRILVAAEERADARLGVGHQLGTARGVRHAAQRASSVSVSPYRTQVGGRVYDAMYVMLRTRQDPATAPANRTQVDGSGVRPPVHVHTRANTITPVQYQAPTARCRDMPLSAHPHTYADSLHLNRTTRGRCLDVETNRGGESSRSSAASLSASPSTPGSRSGSGSRPRSTQTLASTSTSP